MKPTSITSRIQAAGRRFASLAAIVAMATAAQAGTYVNGVPAPGANDFQFNASAAASLYAGQPDTPHANELSVNKNNGWKIESMLNFDVSSLAGKTVRSAALYLYLSRWEGTGDVGVGLHSLNGIWDPATVTWNSYGNFVGAAMDSVTLQDGSGYSPGWVKLDVTPALVQRWINENPRMTSYGLGLVPTAWGANSMYNAAAIGAANQPVLVVTVDKAGMYVAAVPAPGANDYQFNASAAASLYSGSPDATHANELSVNKNSGWKIESLLNFDVSSLAGKTVQGAALYLYMTPWEGTDDVGVGLHSLNGIWDPATVTWNSYNGYSVSDNPAMDCVTLSRSGGVDGTGWVKLDVTPALVQGWINEDPRTTSYGLGLVPTAWGANSMYNAAAIGAANQPVLVVTVKAGMYVAAVPTPGANDFQFNASAAASLYSGSPNATHANELTVNKNNGWKIESLLNFDVSSLTGKTVQGAALYLYLARAEGADNVGVGLHSLNGAWDQAAVTWNNYAQGNFVSTAMDSVTLQDGSGYSPGWVKLDVTPALVQGWINEYPRTTSYGLGLVPTAWGANSAYWAYAPNAANQPVLAVTVAADRLYDDFLGASLDTAATWTATPGGGSNTVSSSILAMTSDADAAYGIKSKATFAAAQNAVVTFTLGGPWIRTGETNHYIGFADPAAGMSGGGQSIWIRDDHQWQGLTLSLYDGSNPAVCVDIPGIVESDMIAGDQLSIQYNTAFGGTAKAFYNGAQVASISGHNMPIPMAATMICYNTSATFDSVSVSVTGLPSAVVPNGLGINTHFTAESPAPTADLNMIQAAGVKLVRTDVCWNVGEQTPEVYNFAPTEALAHACAARGIRVFGILDYDNPAVYPTDPASAVWRQRFANFAVAMAAHFSADNIIWELWNEPNGGFWPGGPNADQYMALANVVVPAMRQADPNAVIVGPALLTADTTFLTKCLDYGQRYPGQRGLLDLVDAVSMHPYRSESPEAVVTDYSTIRDLMQTVCGTTKPIVSSEWGYSTASPGVTSQLQGDYLARTFLVNLSQGIPCSNWYDWKNDGSVWNEIEQNFGTVTADLVTKPAYYAMQRLTSSLQGKTFTGRLSSDPQDWLLTFTSPDDSSKTTLAGWTTRTSPYVVTVANWGTYLLTSTPFYVNPAQTRDNGSGNWYDNSWASGSEWIEGSQAVFSSAGSTITVNGAPSVSVINFGNSGYTLTGGALNLGGGGSINTGPYNVTINSVLAGDSELRKIGDGTLTLGGANTYTGATTVSAGVLRLSGDGSINSTSGITLNGGTLDLHGNNLIATTMPDPTMSLAITIETAGSTLANSAADTTSTFTTANPRGVALHAGLTVNAVGDIVLSDVGSYGLWVPETLTKTGVGTLTLGTLDSYDNSGLQLQVNEGRVKLNKASASGLNWRSSAVCITGINSGAVVQYTGTGDFQVWDNGSITLTGGTLDLNGMNQVGTTLIVNTAGSTLANGAATASSYTPTGVTLNAGLTVNTIGGLTLNGPISGSGGLTKTGAGLLMTLSGTNTYTGGTTVNVGNLKFNTTSAIPSTGTTMINSGGAVLVSGAYTTVQNWLNSGKINTGSTGALAFTANNSGAISMGSYTNLSIGANGSYIYSGTLTPAGSTYRFGGGGGTLTVSPVLSGSRSLVVAGNVTLTGASTYTGATTVNAGTLKLSGSGAINSSSGITLNGGTLLQDSSRALNRAITFTNGTFGGTGTYTGNLSLGSCHLSPGDGGIGTLTDIGNLSLTASSILDYDFGTTAGVSDRIAFSGANRTLVLDGTINISCSGTLPTGTYTIFSGATSITDNGLVFGARPDGRSWSYTINGGSVYVTVQ